MRLLRTFVIGGLLLSSSGTLAQYYTPNYYYPYYRPNYYYPPGYYYRPNYYYPPNSYYPPPPPSRQHQVVTPVTPGSGPADWCANTRSAVAVDRCARYRAGEPQPEQYYYKPSNNNQPPIERQLPKCTEADKPNLWYRAGVICQP